MRKYLAIAAMLAFGVSQAQAVTITSFGGNMITAGAAVPTPVITNYGGTVNISILGGLAGSLTNSPILVDLSVPGYTTPLGFTNVGPGLVVTGGWGSVSFGFVNPATLQATPATNGGVLAVDMIVTAEAGSNDFGGLGQLWQFNISYSFVTFYNGGYTTDQGIDQVNAFNANRVTNTIPEPGSMALWGLGAIVGMGLLRRRRLA